MSVVHPDAVLSAFAEIDGDNFESFFKEFASGLLGLTFSPVGGKKDGGADGFSERGLYETSRRLTYFQATIQENARDKIRKTVNRLREYGREIGSLTYFTSRILTDPDKISVELSTELDCNITIWDGQWIANRINESDITKASYENHLRYFFALKNDQRRNSTIAVPHIFNTNAAIFISQNASLTPSKDGVRGGVIDSLILYVMEDSAVAKDGFLTSLEIYDKVKKVFPVKLDIDNVEVATRLAFLSSKDHPSGRQLVWNDKEVGYSLPFESRSAIENQHAAFEALIFKVREQIAEHILIECVDVDLDESVHDVLVDCTMKCLEWIFMEEGMKVAQFLNGGDEDISEDTVSDVALRAMKELKVPGRHADVAYGSIMSALRNCFYKATDQQREYLAYLARTYSLLFSLKYDLKIASYFKDMQSGFRLVVGTDVIIQALSESRLSEPNRLTHNMLRALRASGAELILTDQVVEEVYTHIVAADAEFRNHYQEQDQYMTLDLARNSDRVLIRSYYYAKFDPPTPSLKIGNWNQFLEQFVPYDVIKSGEARIALRTYLSTKFGMRLETREEVLESIDAAAHWKLARKFLDQKVKDKKVLAENDAALVLFVYALRAQSREMAKASPVGYRTWWLTSETRIQRYFEDLVGRNGKVIMRPQVAMQLLNFAPNADEVKNAFGAIMPSVVGVRIGNRVPGNVLRGLLDAAKRVAEDDPARMAAEMERISNRFKANEAKAIEHKLTSGAEFVDSHGEEPVFGSSGSPT